jgi:hypothetical protein
VTEDDDGAPACIVNCIDPGAHQSAADALALAVGAHAHRREGHRPDRPAVELDGKIAEQDVADE